VDILVQGGGEDRPPDPVPAVSVGCAIVLARQYRQLVVVN
jgi:hypothetical protein